MSQRPWSQRNPVRFLAAFAAATSLGLAGCSEDLPSRDEFIAEAKAQIPTALSDRLADSGIEPATANRLLEDHLGCIYDAISSDEQFVRAVTEGRDSATTDEIADLAPECVEQVNRAILEAILPSDT